jgi:hypothetical protein
MTLPQADVKFYLDHVKVVIEGATDEALSAAAHQIEGAAKVKVTENGQVDTGFMRSAIYTVAKTGSGYGAAQAEAQGKAGGQKRAMAPEQRLPGDKNTRAAVVAGANYSIYQEAAQSFLFAGADAVKTDIGGTVERVYREKVHD